VKIEGNKYSTDANIRHSLPALKRTAGARYEGDLEKPEAGQ